MSVFKAQAHMRELVQRLQLTIKGATIEQATDVDGFPQIRVVYSTEVILAKIMMEPQVAQRVDGLGLPQRAYSPHKAQLLQDADIVTPEAQELKARLAAAVGKMGMKVEVYSQDKADLPASAAAYDVATATLICVLPSDEINPLIQSQ